MPTFFQFTQGTESYARAHAHDSSPLLGRFRAVPPDAENGRRRRRSSQLGLLSASFGRGSVHAGYGAAAIAAGLHLGTDSDDDDDNNYALDDDHRSLNGSKPNWARRFHMFWKRSIHSAIDVWVEPKQTAVRRVVNTGWSRYGSLVGLPALMAIGWCALPFPQYPLPYDDDAPDGDGSYPPENQHRIPGHGAARVQLNFGFFLIVYYGFYNLTALMWITKVFNLYNLNWWPQCLGFPLTMSIIAIISLAAPIPIYLHPTTKFLTVHNTAWISWTFLVMALPVAVAFLIIMTNERHLGPRHSLSETQRIFTSSWWTSDSGSISARREPIRSGRSPLTSMFDDADLSDTSVRGGGAGRSDHTHGRHRSLAGGLSTWQFNWFPASFVRFLWFCIAMFIGLMVYVIGEAYAEIYLRTLPHDNLETILYVYSWIGTVHLLDALTAWTLGSREGERVGSYPLSWTFKLYFMLTYQTYVRALYARLRSPQQFVLLQVLSSSSLILLTPITMSATYHRVMIFFGFSDQSYGSYQKLCLRNIFIRSLAENASMAAFLGSVLVLHFGPNKDVYPYFAFDDSSEPYGFDLTFKASAITWVCELTAGAAVRGLVWWFYAVDVELEGRLDLTVWPELLPTCAAVTLHVLQNMYFSIIRLQFR